MTGQLGDFAKNCIRPAITMSIIIIIDMIMMMMIIIVFIIEAFNETALNKMPYPAFLHAVAVKPYHGSLTLPY